MNEPVPTPLLVFLERSSADFSRIARATRGEWTPDDVRQHAWLLAHDLGESRGTPLDLDNAADASWLVRCLYNHCVKFTDTRVRHAVRLDHAAPGDNESDHHWLADRLAADDGMHPASLLETLESAPSEPRTPDPLHSAAASWLWLMHRFNHRMTDVAAFLLISVSWCNTCQRRARHRISTQWPLPYARPASSGDPVRPWRKFKLPSTKKGDEAAQLRLDYWAHPEQPAIGQLWLL